MNINQSLNQDQTYYEILDISPDASPQDVREAYIRCKSTYGRDSIALYSLVSSEERELTLRKIEEAYQILSSSDKRREYDRNYGILSTLDPLVPVSENQPTSKKTKIISIDRVPPMDIEDNSEQLLIPPKTDFHYNPAHPRTSPPLPSSPLSLEHSAPIALRNQTAIISPSRNQPHRPIPNQTFRSGLEVRTNRYQLDLSLLSSLENESEWSGGLLKQLRETFNISLEEMSGITKISRNYLLAIECEDFKKLPAAVYVRGFVMQIAKVLKLPYDRVCRAYISRFKLGQKG